MTGCPPTVAQALLPFPQYCNNIIIAATSLGLDENLGSSTYHAFQLKAEHRFSNGLWALLSYTNSKLITNADNTETIFNPTYFSPFEIGRNRSLAIEDVPQALNIASSYELPFGRGKRWLTEGVPNAFFGHWALLGAQRPDPKFADGSLRRSRHVTL
jgi:hypothetical protein